MSDATTSDAIRSGDPGEDAERLRAAQRLTWVRNASGDPALQLARASTDAGFRSYWRGTGRGGSVIVMDSPPALEDVRPWLAMRDVLDAGGVRVPRVHARDVEGGWLLLEDLGAKTCLQAIDPDHADATFDAAIAQLLTLQAVPPPAWLPAYDRALLQRELDLFETWFLGRHLGVALDPGERQAWQRINEALIAAALAQAQVLVHRDYMLRNLMPAGGDVAVIDFQDAVRGPIAYDVLSLFKDAFTSWPPDRITTWVGRYHARAAAAGLPVPSRDTFQRDLDWIGVQRHLKVLGIFARLNHRDGKPHYLQDAPRFVGYLTEVVTRYPELAPLDALLERHVRHR